MPGIDVLLVEDSRADACMLREALAQAGLDRLHALEDGAAAMDFLYRRGPYRWATPPALIILDLNLPLKNGREVLAEICPNLELRQIPLVILTSSTGDRHIVETFGLPADCYLVKPTRFDEYVEMVKAIEAFRQSAGNCATA